MGSFYSYTDGDKDFHITLHAVKRFNERVFNSDKERLSAKEINCIRQIIFDEVFEHLGSEEKRKVTMTEFNCKAVIENKRVITITKL